MRRQVLASMSVKFGIPGSQSGFGVAAYSENLSAVLAVVNQASQMGKARYAHPIVEQHHCDLLPGIGTPLPGLFVPTITQVYPQDRGTRYAICKGLKAAADLMLAELANAELR